MTQKRYNDDVSIVLQAVSYIEENLSEKLSVDMMASHVGFSKFHFSRIFDKHVGMSPYDYYRGRKVTETIHYLQKHQCKIIDAAYQYGFSSPEVFVRACKGVFDCSPSAIRKELENGTFTGVEPLSEHMLEAPKDFDISWEIRFLPELVLSGIGYFSDKIEEVIANLPEGNLSEMVGEVDEIFMLSWTNKNPMGYMHFVGVNQSDKQSENSVHSELLTKTIPKMSYLVFNLKMQAEELSYCIRYIYDKLLPELSFEQPLPYHLEGYNRVTGSSQIFIPVVPDR